MDHRYELSRRSVLHMLGVGTAGALIAAGCRPSQEAEQEAQFNGAWPYTVPPKGHFNVVTGVLDSILGNGGIYIDLIVPPAAMYYWEQQKYEPVLAKSWKLNKSAKTFQYTLKDGLTWSNGKPVTSQDVVTSFTMLRIIRNVIWNFLDRVEALDEHTVEFHMSKPATVVERYALRSNIYSHDMYSGFAKQADELFGGGGSLDSDEGKKLNEDFQEFRPKKVIASGPFVYDYDSITNAQLTLVKNTKGYGADQVRFSRVVLFNGETPDVTPVVLAKRVDYATHGFPPATEKSFIEKGFRILRPPTYNGPALYFNYAKFPEFRDKRVRQALAYAIDRDENGTVSLGESGKNPKFMCGLSDNLVPQWISAKDQETLDSYENDQKMAEKLLTDAGWKKDGNSWMKPDGGPAKYELMFISEYADWAASGKNLADQLTKFGFDVTARGVTFTQQPVDVDRGRFELAIQAWGSSTQPHPQYSYHTALFLHNYPVAANQGGRGMDFDLKQETDALGKVDLEKVVVDSGRGLNEAEEKKNVTTAAVAFNELLPIIPIFERYGNNPALEGERVDKWPPDDDPIMKNSPYADNFTTLLMLTGRLDPA